MTDRFAVRVTTMGKFNVGVEASSWGNILAGLAIAGIAWYGSASYNAAFYSGVIAGLLLVVAGAWAAWDARSGGARSIWVGAFSILVGAWIFAYPWFAVLSSFYEFASLVIGGAVVLVSAYETYAARSASSRSRERRPTA